MGEGGGPRFVSGRVRLPRGFSWLLWGYPMTGSSHAWPRVTVIVVNWNGEPFLHRCLSALSVQTVPPHEIILVDNASTDASLQIAQGFPQIQVLRQARNLGFAAANNLAIQATDAASQWIALVNPDAFVQSDWLEALLAAARDYPDCCAFGSTLVSASYPSLLDGVGDVYHVSGLAWRGGHGLPVSSCPERVREIFSPCAAAAMYRRIALNEMRGFDEDYFCYMEDVDLGFRLRLAGHHCMHVPNAVVHHIGSGASGGKHSVFSVYHGHRNLVWCYVSNMPGALFWLFMPLHLLANVCAMVLFAWRGMAPTIRDAKRDALQGLGRALHKRRRVQSARKVTVWQICRVLDWSWLATARKMF